MSVQYTLEPEISSSIKTMKYINWRNYEGKYEAI